MLLTFLRTEKRERIKTCINYWAVKNILAFSLIIIIITINYNYIYISLFKHLIEVICVHYINWILIRTIRTISKLWIKILMGVKEACVRISFSHVCDFFAISFNFEVNTRDVKNTKQSSFLRGYLKRNVVQILSHICTRHDLMHVSKSLPRKCAPQSKSHGLRGTIYFSLDRIFTRMKVKEYEYE